MLTITIKNRGCIFSVQQFVDEIGTLTQCHDSPNQKFMYRGHANRCFFLKPSVGRVWKYAGKALRPDAIDEQNLLHRFRRRSYPHIGHSITAGEALFMARHHHLPTRLLDWSANPLFALYFTCFEHLGHDGKVWAILRLKDETHDIDSFKLARLKSEKRVFNYRARGGIGSDHAIKIVHPFYNTPRLVAQDGAFTIHSHPRVSIECYVRQKKEFRDMNLDFDKLYCWQIPKENKPDIVKALSSLGITRRSVYPDLDGIAGSLWETEVLWKGRKCSTA
jgi:hypothetical protein